MLFVDFPRYLHVFLDILACMKKPKLGKSLLLVDFPRYLQVFLDSMVCRNEGLPREGRDFKLKCTFLKPKKLILVVLALF